MDGWVGKGKWMGACMLVDGPCMHTHAKHADLICEWLSPLGWWVGRCVDR